MVTTNVCPVCLDDMDTNTPTTIAMPVCQHSIHTVCALRAAQYDLRCPVCRTSDPSFIADPTVTTVRPPDMFQQLDELNHQHTMMMRQYQRRRLRTIRRNQHLISIRNRLTAERQNFDQATRELERMWMIAQRQLWKEDPPINHIKRIRRRHQQRVSALTRSLNNHIERELGPSPSLHIEHFFLYE